MIKINYLGNETYERLQRSFKGDSPVIEVNRDPDAKSVNIRINDEALLMHTRDEVSIYYKGNLFRMSDYFYLTIEIE